MSDERVTGVTKWFNSQKGYGFIVPDIKGKDVFVHYKALVGDGYKTLREGDKVEYKVIDSEKGLQAIDVVVMPKE